MSQENPQATSSGYPIYSLAQLQELGLDPAKVPSCGPTPAQSGNRAVLGCQCHAQCRFDRGPYATRQDGTMVPFKGKRPQRIGYFYKTIEGREKTDMIACHQFVTTMQAAMDEGVAAALRGERHEIVRVIAQEGESFKRIKTKVGPLNKDGSPNWKTVLEDVTVTPMVEEGQDVYEQYRKQVAEEYVPGTLPAAEAYPETQPTVAPGRPVAVPASKANG